MSFSIKDIAEKAGLSRMTVWRALNGKDGNMVSLAAREKIEQAVNALQFSYADRASRLALPRGGKKKITMLAPTTDDEQLSTWGRTRHLQFFQAAMQKASARGYVLEVIPISHTNSSTKIAWEFFDEIGPGSMVLGCDSWYMFALMELARRGAKVAMIMANVFWGKLFSPQMQNWATFFYHIGGRPLIEYYLQQGRTRIARAVWEDYMHEPDYPGICDYDEVLSAAGNDYRHVIPIGHRKSFSKSIAEAYMEKSFDALVFNYGENAIKGQADPWATLGLPKSVWLGQAIDSQAQKSPACPIDRLTYDWDQMVEDAIQALTAEPFVPVRKDYVGTLILADAGRA